MQPIRLFAFRCTNPEEVIAVSFFLTPGTTVVLRSEHASSNCPAVCVGAASARVFDLPGALFCGPPQCRPAQPWAKKTDVAEHPKVFDHVGLLANGPPG